MKEKLNMTAFLAAGMGDITTTAYGLSRGFSEVGLGGRFLVESGYAANALVLRMAFTAVIIGAYALTETRGSRFAYSFDRAIRIGNFISWGILALNTVRLASI